MDAWGHLETIEACLRSTTRLLHLYVQARKKLVVRKKKTKKKEKEKQAALKLRERQRNHTIKLRKRNDTKVRDVSRICFLWGCSSSMTKLNFD